MNKVDSSQCGFALLMTLIVVGVVLSVGLAILDLSIKQANLSTNAKESEVAFHAANAGLECAHYWRRKVRDDIKAGNTIDIECFGNTVNGITKADVPSSGDGDAYRYDYELSWGAPDQRCTKVRMLAMFGDISGTTDLTVTQANLRAIFTEFNTVGNKVCAAGEQCTMLGVRGYNRPCGFETGFGAIQRQVLLEF